MKIESVNINDTEELLNIYAPYVEKTAVSFEYEVPSFDEFEERIVNISSKYPYLKAVSEEGEILGYSYAAAYKTRRAYDWSVETTIYIKQDRKRLGLGSALYNELEKRLMSMGILNMNACIAYPKSEDPYLTKDSVLFHTKMGFSMIGTFHDSGYKFGRWYDMVWMEKMIGDHLADQPDVKWQDQCEFIR